MDMTGQYKGLSVVHSVVGGVPWVEGVDSLRHLVHAEDGVLALEACDLSWSGQGQPITLLKSVEHTANCNPYDGIDDSIPVLGQHTVSCADDSAMPYMPVVSYAPCSISARDPC